MAISKHSWFQSDSTVLMHHVHLWQHQRKTFANSKQMPGGNSSMLADVFSILINAAVIQLVMPDN